MARICRQNVAHGPDPHRQNCIFSTPSNLFALTYIVIFGTERFRTTVTDGYERKADRHHRDGGGLLKTRSGRSGHAVLDSGMCQCADHHSTLIELVLILVFR